MVVVCVRCRAVHNAFLFVRMCCPLALRGKNALKETFRGDLRGELGGLGQGHVFTEGLSTYCVPGFRLTGLPVLQMGTQGQ